MPLYEFRCRICRNEYLSTDREPPTVHCGRCSNNDWKRVWSVQIAPVMQAHWNQTVGGEVSDMKKFKHELAKKSAEMTERTGVPHDYQPVDPRDRDSMRVTDEGLDSTYDRKVKTGQLERGSLKSWQ